MNASTPVSGASGWFGSFLRKHRFVLSALLALGCLVLVGGVLIRQDWAEVMEILRATDPMRLVSVAALIALSFVALSAYDFLAIRLAGYRWPGIGRVLRASFVGFVFSMNFGFTIFSGGGVRVFYYTRAGIPPRGVASMFAHMAVTFLLGWLGLFGLTLCFWPNEEISARFGWGESAQRLLGVVLLLGLAGYLAGSFLGWRPGFGRFAWQFPRPALAVLQVAVSLFDACVAGLVLFHVLPSTGVSFVPFLGAFLTAVFLGMASHVPGGLGVIEVTLMLLLGASVPPEEVLAGMVLYRLLNFVAPLALAGSLFAWDAARASRSVN